MYIQENNSYLFFVIRRLTSILFMITNYLENIVHATIVIIIGIIVFEIFRYFYGDTPDIIITDHEDVEKTYALIKNTIIETIEENSKEADTKKEFKKE